MKRILVVRTDRVGDVVTITPVLRALRNYFMGSFIGTLTNSNSVHVLTNNPNVDVMIEDDFSKGSFFNVVREIRSYKFTDALLMLPTERAAYQLFFAGIRNRIGVGRKLYEVITFMKSVSRGGYYPARHEADYNMDLARKLGVKCDDLRREIFLTEPELDEGERIVSNAGSTKDKFRIAFHIGNGGSAPNWSETKYLHLLKLILEKFNDRNISILLTSREMSKEFLSEILTLNDDRVISITNEFTDLRQLIKVYSTVNLAIGPSTGPMHIADALCKPVIAIFCSRNIDSPARWGMGNPEAVNIQVSDEHCKNCCSPDKEICDIENGILPEDVLKKVEDAINRSK